MRRFFLTAEPADDNVYLWISVDSQCAFRAQNERSRTTMDELDRAVGSNPTSSVSPLNWLYSLIRLLSADEFDSTNDSRMLKLLCFLSLQFFVETHVELHLPEQEAFSRIH